MISRQTHSNFSWTILSKGERRNEVNPMWSTNLWDKASPQHRELRALLFAHSYTKYNYTKVPGKFYTGRAGYELGIITGQ